jgi:hypothetical protein
MLQQEQLSPIDVRLDYFLQKYFHAKLKKIGQMAMCMLLKRQMVPYYFGAMKIKRKMLSLKKSRIIIHHLCYTALRRKFTRGY